MHGSGVTTFKKGFEYNGNFVNGREHGQGKLSLGIDIYEGVFDEGKFEGMAVIDLLRKYDDYTYIANR